MAVHTARAVGAAGTALVAASLVGGTVSVAAGTNTWATGWTSQATLAAPWPMLLVQAGATVLAAQPDRRLSLIGCSVLGLSAAVSGVSGFFDGQLGRSDLGPGYVAAQVGYVVVAWLTVAAAGARLRSLRGWQPRAIG